MIIINMNYYFNRIKMKYKNLSNINKKWKINIMKHKIKLKM